MALGLHAPDGSMRVVITDGDGNEVTISQNTEYTEGATDATITGIAALMEGAGNALVPVQGTAADGVLVNLGSNNDVTVTGDVTTVPGVSANLSRVAVNISSAATTSLVAAVADQETRVYKVFLTIGGANNLTWQSANDTLGGVLQFTGPGSFVLDFDGEPWLVTATNEALQLTTSTAAQVSGFVYYITS